MTDKKIKIKFLEESMHLNHSLRNALDLKANFLLAISSAILLLSFTLDNKYLSLIAGLAVLASIIAIGYPFKRKMEYSNLCWWGIKKSKNFITYQKLLSDKINNEDDLIEEYEKEIYSLYQNSMRPKLFFIRTATYILLLVIILLAIFKLT